MIVSEITTEKDMREHLTQVVFRDHARDSWAFEYNIKGAGRVDYVMFYGIAEGLEGISEMFEFKSGTNFHHAIGQLLFYEHIYGHKVKKTIVIPYQLFAIMPLRRIELYLKFMRYIESTLGITFVFCSVRSDDLIPSDKFLGVRAIYGAMDYS